VQRNRERLREFDPGNPEARGVSGEPAAAEQ
jgi:hypothetical protein